MIDARAKTGQYADASQVSPLSALCGLSPGYVWRRGFFLVA